MFDSVLYFIDRFARLFFELSVPDGMRLRFISTESRFERFFRCPADSPCGSYHKAVLERRGSGILRIVLSLAAFAARGWLNRFSAD